MTPRARGRTRAPLGPMLVSSLVLLAACSEAGLAPRQPVILETPGPMYSGVPLQPARAQAPVLHPAPAGLTPPAVPAPAGALAGGESAATTPGATPQATATPVGPVRHLFLQNLTTGDRVLWLSTGGTITNTLPVGNVPAQWQMRGAGDMNGDGKDDIVWQDTTTGGVAVWYLDGTGQISSTAMLGVVPVEWKIAGVGDYNGDSKDDLLWWHAPTGTLLFWNMNGSGGVSSSTSPGSVPAPWKPTAARDLNGDGKSDILWENMTAGTSVVWYISGGAIAGSAALASVPPSWSQVGTTDLDGDGKQDIVWQNVSAGAIAVWYMDGAGNTTSSASLPAMSAGYRLGALVRPATTTPVPTVTFTGMFAGNLSTPANLSAVNATLIVQAGVSLPAGSSVAAINFNVDSRTVCSQTMPPGASGNVTFSCQIQTDLLTGGVPTFANGPHTIVAALLSGTGTTLASTAQAVTFANPSSIVLSASATKAPVINQITGRAWKGGDLTVTATPQVFEGSPIARVTITVAPKSGGASSSKTVTTPPFTATWSAATLLASGGVADVQDSVRITVSGVTADGQAFTGPTATAMVALDNVAPTITVLSVPATNWVNAAYAFGSLSNPRNLDFSDAGVDNATVRFYVGPTAATATTQVTTGADLTEGVPVVLKAVATDALGNAATYYPTPFNSQPSTDPNDPGIRTLQVDKTVPVISFPAGVGNSTDGRVYTTQRTYTFSIADVGTFASGFIPNPVSVRQVLATPSGRSCVAPSTPDLAGACTYQPGSGLTATSASTSGYDSLFAYVSDRAGNKSSVISRTVLIDNVAPGIGGLAIPAVSTGGQQVQVSAAATDNIAVASAYAMASYSGGSTFTLRYPTTTLASFGQFNPSSTANATIDFLIRSMQESNASTGAVSSTWNNLTGYALTVMDLAGSAATTAFPGLTSAQVPQAPLGFNFASAVSSFVGFQSAATICYVSSGTTGASCPAGVPSSTLLRATATLGGGSTDPFARVAFFRLSNGMWRFIGYALTVAWDGGLETFTYTMPYDPGPQTFTSGSSTVWTIMAVGINASGDALTSSQSTLTINEQ